MLRCAGKECGCVPAWNCHPISEVAAAIGNVAVLMACSSVVVTCDHNRLDARKFRDKLSAHYGQRFMSIEFMNGGLRSSGGRIAAGDIEWHMCICRRDGWQNNIWIESYSIRMTHLVANTVHVEMNKHI